MASKVRDCVKYQKVGGFITWGVQNTVDSWYYYEREFYKADLCANLNRTHTTSESWPFR